MFLEIKNLSGGYGKKEICKNLNLTLGKGEILSVLGPNGCGKTTFFRLLLGAIPRRTGDVLIHQHSLFSLTKKELAKQIAYIPQYHSPVFSYTVLEVVLMSRVSYISVFSMPTKMDQEAVYEALEKLQISHLANRIYSSLSGGQRQLVLIARAICQKAHLLIMDEPGASLDYANHFLLMETMIALAKEGYTIMISTHSPEQPFMLSDQVLMMKNGQVVSNGKTSEAITPEILKKVYEIDMDIVSVVDRYGKKRTLCLPVKNDWAHPS